MKKSTFFKTLLVAAGLLGGSSAWATETTATLDHTAGAQWGSNTGASTVDAEKEHYNNNTSSAWAGCAYAKFSFTLPEGESITQAMLTYSVNQGGKSGRDDIIYYMAKDFDLDWANFAGQTGTDLRNTASRVTAVAAAATGGTGDRLNLTQDVTTAVRAIYEAGQSYIIFQWTGNAGGADLYGKGSANMPSLVITTSAESTYAVTFTESNGVAATITVGGSDVTSGTLLVNGTYDFTATAAGYQDYNGSFTVAGADKEVTFTMTAKPRYTFTMNAVDVDNNVIKAIYTDSDSYEGKTHNIIYPKYLTGTGNIVTYSKANDTYGESKIAQAQNETYTVSYTAYDGVAWFVEIEDVVSATAYSSWNCSNGSAVRGFTSAKDIFTVPATGTYDITYAICNHNVNSSLSCTLSKNEDEIATKSDLQYVSINYIKTTGIVANENVSLTSGDALKLKPSTTNGIVDYMLIELKSVTATIGSTGYATFSSTYALDFTDVTALTAYTATACDGETVTLTEVTGTVAANTGLVIKGETADIPVVAEGNAQVGNMLFALDGSYSTLGAGTNGTNYVLSVQEDKVVFAPIEGTGAPVTAGHAALFVPEASSAKLRLVFADELANGINGVTAVSNADAAIYNLSGQRMNAAYKGIVIKNGKKFINK